MTPSVTMLTSFVATVTSSESASSQIATITTVQIPGSTITATVPSSQASSQTTSVPVFTGSSALKGAFEMRTVVLGLLVAFIGGVI